MKRALLLSLLALLLVAHAHGVLAREVIEVWRPPWAWTYPDVMDEFMARFEEEHPEYEVRITEVAGGQGEFESKLLTAIVGGTAPVVTPAKSTV